MFKRCLTENEFDELLGQLCAEDAALMLQRGRGGGISRDNTEKFIEQGNSFLDLSWRQSGKRRLGTAGSVLFPGDEWRQLEPNIIWDLSLLRELDQRVNRLRILRRQLAEHFGRNGLRTIRCSGLLRSQL